MSYCKEIEEHKKKLKLTPLQREIIIGKLLGDAHLETQNKGRTYRLKIEHSLKQKEYVEFLYEAFKDWVLSSPRVRNVELKGRTYQNLVFSTVSHAAFRFYAHQFYRGRVKVIPKIIRRLISPRSLAFWYMDDGSIKSSQNYGVILNTQGYALKEVEELISVLKQRFNIRSQLRKQKEGYQIYILGESYPEFYKIVFPYLLDSMKYKFKKPS